MKLYHFTAQRFLDGIKKEGLTRGVMVKSFRPVTFIANKQWLTVNPEWEQSWAKGTGRLPYKRNEVRLTISIPEDQAKHCRSWNLMKFIVPEVAADLSAFGDPDNWYIFDGIVRPEWIIAVDQKPAKPKEGSGNG